MRDNDTSLEGEVIHNETHQDSPVKKPDTTMAMVNYGLYLASFLVGSQHVCRRYYCLCISW